MATLSVCGVCGGGRWVQKVGVGGKRGEAPPPTQFGSIVVSEDSLFIDSFENCYSTFLHLKRSADTKVLAF